MGMTIDEAADHIKYGIIENNYPLSRDLGVEACNVAIETMRKYQKIEDIYYHQSGQALENSLKEVIENGKI